VIMATETVQITTLLTDIVRVLDDKKAADLRVFRVSAQSSITDYLVLATGTSEPHLRALRIELERVLDSRKAKIAGMETGEPGSGWTVVDAYQIMIHLFTREKREEYRLENLWKDAQDLSIARLLNPEAEGVPEVVAKPAAAPKKKKAVGRKTPLKKAPARKAAVKKSGAKAKSTKRLAKAKSKSTSTKSTAKKRKPLSRKDLSV